ncbi:MAG: galactose mutarotase [Oscillospiraceae bacterium]|nr:galactose mutarotase [Oscillospiraceae bacterium]
MAVEFSPFGRLSDGRPVTAACLTNRAGTSVIVLDYGATIQSLRVPAKDGTLVDVVLGYDSAEEYERSGDYLGATIGRVANRIGGAAFSLNGRRYELAKNDGENHLHGGFCGFDKRFWRMAAQGDSLLCWRTSPDGEENYPGNLEIRVLFSLSEDNRLSISYDADTDADTPLNMTNHSYFNLNGSGSILSHCLQLFAERFCENDAGCLPTGRLLPVEGTAFDFRREKEISADINADDEQLVLAGGYDHNYVLAGRKAAVVCGDRTGIELTVETDLPGVQLYTANMLGERIGKGGRTFGPREAFCLETQLFPNAMNCWGFPSPILHAGEHMHSETVYSFRLR